MYDSMGETGDEQRTVFTLALTREGDNLPNVTESPSPDGILFIFFDGHFSCLLRPIEVQQPA